MIEKVSKRDGSVVPFDESRVYSAISSAYAEVYGELTEEKEDEISQITDNVIESISSVNETVDVETIQNIVEQEISAVDFCVAKAYITYRYKREMARNDYNALMDIVSEKLKAENVENQNANVDEKSFGGRIGSMSGAVAKHYALNYCMSKKAKENHLNNTLYTHDLDSYTVGMHNCLTSPIDKLLAKGFNTRQCDVRPANSISTAFQLVAVIFQIQSLQQFGGVSAGHIDWSMIPYVRKSFTKHLGDGLRYVEKISEYKTKRFHKWIANDKEKHPDGTIHFDDKEFQNQHPEAWEYAMDMTIKETYQAVEGMYHNLNTLQSRSGNQLPFSSINYGTCTLPEGRLVIKALLDTSIKGVGKLHKTSIFPCGIFQMMKGVNRKSNDPNYDLYRLALKSTAKRLYPNYANVNWSGNTGYDPNDPKTYFSTMGCRTANGWDINGFGQLKDGRGNICPVTIILPTLAMMANGEIGNKDIESFMNILVQKIGEAREQLIERFEWICSQSPDSARFMYENGTMAGYVPEEGIRSALKHGTLAIGQLGLAETLQILIGKDHTTDEGMALAKRIEGIFKELCAKYKEQDKLNFGVYYTPAENLCYTAMSKFKKEYGEIPNISDRDYFTNSIHVPVWHELTPFEKIDIEAQLTGYSSAGCITYVELPESAQNNIDALETIVNYAMDKDVPYFAINVPNDICDDCGFTGEMNDMCPKCGSSNIKRLRRVTGYLTGDYKTAFNIGKQREAEQRVKHIQ